MRIPKLCSQPLKVILAPKTLTGYNPMHKANLDWTLILVVDVNIVSFAVDQGIDATLTITITQLLAQPISISCSQSSEH